ncbi:MAG: hypothetical protein OXM55_04855 [Bdellovibrionales bacterium]|nr:hypothetical protein [Bdellovibrionales bacterium]
MSIVASWTKKWAEKRNQPFLFYTKTSSTNDRAKEYLLENIPDRYRNDSLHSISPLGKKPTETTKSVLAPYFREGRVEEIKQDQYKNFLFIAEFQTKGRGRKNRKWINSDMMTSWSHSLKQAPQPITVELMGQALCDALSLSWPSCPFRIKKPNDIYIKNKKMAGLLVEVVNKGNWYQLIIGLGMNVLTHPPSPCFTDLKKHVAKESITEKKWILFLDEWYKNRNAQIKKCVIP